MANSCSLYMVCVIFCSMKTALPSPSLTGFTSPVSTSVGDRESYHGNLVVSPGKCYANNYCVSLGNRKIHVYLFTLSAKLCHCLWLKFLFLKLPHVPYQV